MPTIDANPLPATALLETPDEVAMAVNRVELAGVVAICGEWRVTPAGRPMVVLELGHESAVCDLPPLSRVAVQMRVVALDGWAEFCRDLPVGSRLLVSGRLNQQRWLRQGTTRWGRLELMAQSIRFL